VAYSDPEKGPDLCLIVSFHESLHHVYDTDAYREFRGSLKSAVETICKDWEFHDQLGDPPFDQSKRNLWHPIHIRRPMVDVLSGSGGENTSLQEQAGHVAAKIFELLKTVFGKDSYSFLELRRKEALSEAFKPDSAQICHRLAAQINGLKQGAITAEAFVERKRTYLSVANRGSSSGPDLGANINFDSENPEVYFFADPLPKASEVKRLLEGKAGGHRLDDSGDMATLVYAEDDELLNLEPLAFVQALLPWFEPAY